MKKGMCDARVEEEEGARQHHARYLEPSSVWDFFHSSPRLSASRRQHSTSRIFFQALAFMPSLIGQNEAASHQPLDDGIECDGAVPVQSRRGWSNEHRPAVSTRGSRIHQYARSTILCCGWIPAITTTMTERAVSGSGHGGYVVDEGHLET